MRNQAEQSAYRPVSGLAIAGLGLAGVCALVVVAAGVQALATGVPLLLDAGWLLVPALAAGLSLVARIQIQRSEETRAGLPLARWGLWLSVLTGVCYLAFRVPKEIAVRQEAAAFTDAWFDHLSKADTDPIEAALAFWNTLEPNIREPENDLNNPDVLKQFRASPKDLAKFQQQLELRHFHGGGGQKGRLPAFNDHDLVQLVRRSGGKVEAASRGVRSWEYLARPRTYKVEQNYRVAVPEGTFDVAILVLGGPGRGGTGRQWQVVLFSSEGQETRIVEGRLSELGQLAAVLGHDSRRFAGEWLRKLTEGSKEEAFLETLPPPERERLGRVHWPWLSFLAVPQAGIPPLLAVCGLQDQRLLPGYEAFALGNLIDVRKLKAPAAKRVDIEKQVRQLFQVPKPAVFAQWSEGHATLAGSWEVVQSGDGRKVQFRHLFRLRLPGNLHCEGAAVIASADPALLARLDQARQSGAAPAAGPPREEHHPGWRLAGLELHMGGEMK